MRVRGAFSHGHAKGRTGGHVADDPLQRPGVPVKELLRVPGAVASLSKHLAFVGSRHPRELALSGEIQHHVGQWTRSLWGISSKYEIV